MACKRCEISTFIKDNGVDLFNKKQGCIVYSGTCILIYIYILPSIPRMKGNDMACKRCEI